MKYNLSVQQPLLYKRFYPKGIQRGTIIGEWEFSRWEFIEQAAPKENKLPDFPVQPQKSPNPLYWEDIMVPYEILKFNVT